MLWFKEYANSVLRKVVKCDDVDIDPVYVRPLFDLFEMFHGKGRYWSSMGCGGLSSQERLLTFDILAVSTLVEVNQPAFSNRICQLSELEHWNALEGMCPSAFFRLTEPPYDGPTRPIGFYGNPEKMWESALMLLQIIGLEPAVEDYDPTSIEPKDIKALKFVHNKKLGHLVHAWHDDKQLDLDFNKLHVMARYYGVSNAALVGLAPMPQQY
jgi:hypothetical protein